jgi:hypothetical protein
MLKQDALSNNMLLFMKKPKTYFEKASLEIDSEAF